MERMIEVSLAEGSYLLPLISGRINDLKRAINPAHEKEVPFKGLMFDELVRLEEIQHRLVNLYLATARVS